MESILMSPAHVFAERGGDSAFDGFGVGDEETMGWLAMA